MTASTRASLLVATGVAALSSFAAGTSFAQAQNTTAAPAASAPANAIASAESAAPASVARSATVVTMGASGMSVVRKGTNGWTCMPDAPDTPGPDPMCFDANAAKWVDAWVHHKTPPSNTIGLMYMLEGGTDASNTDPYATKPTSTNAWVKTGPHIMIVGSKEILAGYPTVATDTTAPYVMWAGTPYAHLMVPVGQASAAAPAAASAAQ